MMNFPEPCGARTEAALPGTAITGATCGVLTVAASALSPHTSTVLPEILAGPYAAP